MTYKNRITLGILFATFLVAFLFLFYVFHGHTEDYAIQEAEKLVQDALLTHRALHEYVSSG